MLKNLWLIYQRKMICYTEILSILVAFVVGSESLPARCNIECGVGETCRLVRSTCYYPPCRIVPICVGNSRTEDIVRNGVCPAPPTTPGPCMTQCRQDGDCPNTEKCCFNGCGRTCRRIAQEDIVTKPGTCPSHLRRESLCGVNCENDQDCPGSDKCCLTSCGSVCSKPCVHFLRGSGTRTGFWSLPYLCRRS